MLRKPRFVRVGLIAFAFTAMALLQAHANADTLTATWEGVAYNAFGTSSILGTPQNGTAVEMKFTFDPAPIAALGTACGLFAPCYVPNTFYDQWDSNGKPGMYSSATVSFGGGPAMTVLGDYSIFALADQTKTPYKDLYYNQTYDGSTAFGHTWAFADFYDGVGGITTLSLSQTFSHILSPTEQSSSYFQFFDGTTTIGADVSITSVTVAPIPEPEIYAMMLAGLSLLGFVGRRKQQKITAAA